MFDDEELGKKPSAVKNLEPMSLDELEKYIIDLKDEIKRAEGEIDRKKAHMSSAASIFKS